MFKEWALWFCGNIDSFIKSLLLCEMHCKYKETLFLTQVHIFGAN